MITIKDSNGIQLDSNGRRVTLRKIPNTLGTNVTVPYRVTHLRKNSFTGCGKLTSITLQEKVEDISVGAFDPCTNLEKIIVSPTNKCFESDYKGVLFAWVRGRKWLVCAPQKLSGTYSIPEGVWGIGKDAFKNCKGLTTILLAQSVTTISEGAFRNCVGLSHIIIPQNVNKIEPGAFEGCSKLCGITVASENNAYTSDKDGVLFSKDMTTLLYVPINAVNGRYIVPDTVTAMMHGVFDSCENIKEIYIPVALKDVDSGEFANCKKLEKLCLRDPNGILYDKETLEFVWVWSRIVYANIPDGVTKIPSRAFADRAGLAVVDIPASVTDMGAHVFAGCKNLEEIYVSPENEAFYTDDHGVLFRKIRRNVVLVRAPHTLGESYAVPEGVTHIQAGAFEGCENLTELTIPTSVYSVEQFSFIDCPNLTRMTLSPTTCVFHGQIARDCPRLTVFDPTGDVIEI